MYNTSFKFSIFVVFVSFFFPLERRWQATNICILIWLGHTHTSYSHGIIIIIICSHHKKPLSVWRFFIFCLTVWVCLGFLFNFLPGCYVFFAVIMIVNVFVVVVDVCTFQNTKKNCLIYFRFFLPDFGRHFSRKKKSVRR